MDSERNPIGDVDASSDELSAELEAKRERLDAREAMIAELERRQMVERLLVDAGTIDLDATRLLVEQQLDEAGETMEAGAAVEHVRVTKPHLFRGATDGSGVSAARPSPGARTAHICRAASAARESGQRQDLLSYLRLRRQVQPG